VYRFNVVVTSLVSGDISVNFGGPSGTIMGEAALGWGTIASNPPPMDGTDGNITYGVLGSGFRTPVGAVLNLHFVPAPGAAALIGIGGLVATRRRRA
jgi:hypothetical protein